MDIKTLRVLGSSCAVMAAALTAARPDDVEVADVDPAESDDVGRFLDAERDSEKVYGEILLTLPRISVLRPARMEDRPRHGKRAQRNRAQAWGRR